MDLNINVNVTQESNTNNLLAVPRNILKAVGVVTPNGEKSLTATDKVVLSFVMNSEACSKTDVSNACGISYKQCTRVLIKLMEIGILTGVNPTSKNSDDRMIPFRIVTMNGDFLDISHKDFTG